MLRMEEYEKIRKAVLREGMSQREAARTFGHGRDTIRKYRFGHGDIISLVARNRRSATGW